MQISYLTLLYAMDTFDLAPDQSPLEQALANCRADLFLASFSSDWLFPPEQSDELAAAAVKAGLRIDHRIIQTDEGHDAFLLPSKELEEQARLFVACADKNARQANMVRCARTVTA